jgi:hypothetical protein
MIKTNLFLVPDRKVDPNDINVITTWSQLDPNDINVITTWSQLDPNDINLVTT